jgi:hypothetical protein
MVGQLFEPTFASILSELDRTASPVSIREFWSVDCISHGQSAELNRHHNGNVVDVRLHERLKLPLMPCQMTDTGRDIANLILNYLPAPGEAAPFVLPRRSKKPFDFNDPSALKVGPVAHGHTLAFLGHSLAAIGTLPILAALPDLFSSVVLIDPILLTRDCKGVQVSRAMAMAALTRPHIWGSKAEALKAVRAPKGSFYQRWAGPVRERFEEFGLQSLSHGRVAVRCDVEQEAVRLQHLC